MITLFLKRLSTTGEIPQGLVTFCSYLVIAIIFLFDVRTDASIQMHMLYVLPLTMIALHCDRVSLVYGAVIVALLLQFVTLISYTTLPILSKIIIAILVFPTNLLVAYISRTARTNLAETRRIATIDPLTGLNNRRSIEAYTEREIERQKRYGGVFSFALLDLDDFKLLNDSKGHHIGDEALKLIADVLRRQTRHADSIGRLGGDEFVILMPNTKVPDCTSLCQQLVVEITNRMSDASFPVTASIGCTTIDHPPKSALSIFIKADKAMYEAKAQGKGRVVSL